jgi:molybdopterin molybdotransferase
MISYEAALQLVMAHAPRMGVEECRLEDAAGRVLCGAVYADRAFPPYDRVMMDGYALQGCELARGRDFSIRGVAVAGAVPTTMPADHGTCVEVMTGAPLPQGADCIVPVEATELLADGCVRIEKDFVFEEGRFIHRLGSDAKEGQKLLDDGVVMGSREIGVAASCGEVLLKVARKPRITVIPTGDELVEISEVPQSHQIRQSNGHALRSALLRSGYDCALGKTLRDDATVEIFENVLAGNDWLILTGAVSMGARDFVPRLVREMGCRQLFHGVAQRPGKPVGCWLADGGAMILALPGNPVSAVVGVHALAIPALRVASGARWRPDGLVAVDGSWRALTGMTLHLPVRLGLDGRALAMPAANSGDFIGLLQSDGFVTVPPQGKELNFYPYRSWR